MTRTRIRLTVNGIAHDLEVEPRRLLADVLRHQVGTYGVHLACEQGACGACTVRLDGQLALACLTLAVQADGAEITTVEGLAGPKGELHPVQRAFHIEHGLQCGYCTPGFVLAAADLLERVPDPDDATIRSELSGNLCRCTGYTNIVNAVRTAARLKREPTE
ncbi:MAG: (2Fe-2S)-binding protein [bacterium]|jgi:carbon-monoxide dehydrogenase small subunit|nr:(2Fe-2S)-binding protein [bacterium]